MNSTLARGIEPGFVIVLEYTVEGPEQQRWLVKGLAARPVMPSSWWSAPNGSWPGRNTHPVAASQERRPDVINHADDFR